MRRDRIAREGVDGKQVEGLRCFHYAHELYAALRELDQSRAELILVENVPATAAWSAIADRLQRAASGAGGIGKCLPAA